MQTRKLMFQVPDPFLGVSSLRGGGGNAMMDQKALQTCCVHVGAFVCQVGFLTLGILDL